MEIYLPISLLFVFLLIQGKTDAIKTTGQLPITKLVAKSNSEWQKIENRAEFTCPPTDGFYGIPGECSGNYYACVGGTAIPRTCPNDEIFDPIVNHCVLPQDAPCSSATTTPSTTSTTRTTTTTTATTTTRGPFTCPKPDGFFPIPGTCGSEYYICVGGSSTLTNCPPGNVFDPETLVCLAPEDSSCYQPFSCPASEGFFAIPNTCGSDFYVCVSGAVYVDTCPNGNTFDPVTLICTPYDLATCSGNYKCPASEGFFPIPGACSGSYYVCVGNVPTITMCPADNSVFDPVLMKCVDRGNASC